MTRLEKKCAMSAGTSMKTKRRVGRPPVYQERDSLLVMLPKDLRATIAQRANDDNMTRTAWTEHHFEQWLRHPAVPPLRRSHVGEEWVLVRMPVHKKTGDMLRSHAESMDMSLSSLLYSLLHAFCNARKD